MAAPDTYEGHASLKSQGDSWVTIVPSDSADLARRPKALWVDVAGTLRLRGADGNDETFAVVAGSPLSLRPVRVLSTGTNATGIKAIY